MRILSTIFPNGDISICRIEHQIAIINIRFQKFQQAIDGLKKCRGNLKILGKKESSLKGSINNGLGILYYNLGNYKESDKYLVKAIKFKKKHLEENHIDSELAASYNNLGLIRAESGNINEALQFYMEGLKYLYHAHGEMHAAVARTYTNLGMLFQDQGDFEKSEFYYKESLRIKVELFGENHEDNATVYLNLSEFYLSSKVNLLLAEEYAKKAMKISETSKNYKVVGYALNNLGMISYQKGELLMAKQYLMESMNVKEQLFGGFHQDMISTIQNLGKVCLDLGQYSEAHKYYAIATKFFDLTNYSSFNIDNFLHFNELIINYMKEKKYYKGAEEFCLNFIEKQRKMLGSIKAPKLGSTISQLASIYFLTQQTEKCEQAWFEVLSIALEVSDKSLESDAYNGLGLLYTGIKKLDKGKEFLEKSLSLRVALYGEKSFIAAISFDALGKLFFIKKQLKEAEEFCLKANGIYRDLEEKMTFERMVNEYNLILIYCEKSEYEKIEAYYENIKDFPNSLINEQNSFNQQIFEELSGYFLSLGNEEKALKYSNLIK